ncbi:AtpZ/AtpI family protein [Paenibacillus marinisediminis]
MKSSNDNENLWRIALAISGMGLTLVVYILLGYFVGYGLVQIWDGPKLWLGIGAIVGMFLGIANIIWLVRKFIGGTK